MPTYVARRYGLINGKEYAPGDPIEHPEQLNHPDLLVSEGFIAESHEPNPSPDELAKLKRDELNALAAQQGIEAPEQLPNKDAVIEAVTTGTPPAAAEQKA